VPLDGALVCGRQNLFRIYGVMREVSGIKLIGNKINKESYQVISHFYTGVGGFCAKS
jgi:hypothetical protein